jgi:hypothetical protein
MKRLLTFTLIAAFVSFAVGVQAQGSPNDTPEQKLHRASLPATTKVTTDKGVTITIDYSQPALKGRTMGKDVEPMVGKVWRTGANEATSFAIDKDVTIEGQKLPAGKYGLYTLVGADGSWTIIFNKTWKTWGAFSYKQADDVLRVKVKPSTTSSAMEHFTINADKSGKVSLLWGTTDVDFHVK